MDNNKDINIICSCNNYLYDKYNCYIVLQPCEHIFHINCYNKKNKRCPICKNGVVKFKRENELKKSKNYKYIQQYIDILSVKSSYNNSHINYSNLLTNTIPFMMDIYSLLNKNSEKEIYNSLTQILYDCNIKITIENKPLNNKFPIVFIANHTSYLDSVIIYYLTKCCFVGSKKTISETSIGKKALQILPIIPITREKKKNNGTVKKMKKFIKEKKRSICLFPEGMITHHKTLAQFRTGAFRLNTPIQPIIISYDPVINGSSSINTILKVITQNKINVNVKFMDLYYPPFSDEQIYKIRLDMAKNGNLLLSRISNRLIMD